MKMISRKNTFKLIQNEMSDNVLSNFKKWKTNLQGFELSGRLPKLAIFAYYQYVNSTKIVLT